MPEHTEPIETVRGLVGMPPIPTTEGTHAGGSVSVYESSSAEGPAIWVKVERNEDVQSFAHISAENAWKLSDQLRALVRNHYQGDATPEWDRVGVPWNDLAAAVARQLETTTVTREMDQIILATVTALRNAGKL